MGTGGERETVVGAIFGALAGIAALVAWGLALALVAA
jgi:hypothetical protein